MLGTGLGLNSSNYVGEPTNPNLQYVLHTESISFASSINGVVESSSVVGSLTITAGETAPGSSNSDWLKVVYDSDQTSGSNNAIQIADPFNNAFDFTQGDYLAMSFDIFLETGFAGTDSNTPPVRVAVFQGGKSFVRTTTGEDQIPTNVEVLDFGAFGTGNQRYVETTATNPLETWKLVFNQSSDRPKSGNVFYIRDLKIIAASQDLGTDISDNLFT